MWSAFCTQIGENSELDRYEATLYRSKAII